MLTFFVDVLENGQVVENGPYHLPEFPHEVTLQKYVELKLLLGKQPAWFHEISSAEQGLVESITAEWDNARWIDYYNILAKVVSHFTGCEPHKLMYLGNGDTNLDDMGKKGKGATLQALYNKVMTMLLTYKPKKITQFEYMGDTYLLPKSIKDAGGKSLPGGKMKVIEVIEALQSEKVFTTKRPNGTFVLANYESHVDIAVAAAVSRMQVDGKREEIPIEGNDWDEFFSARCAHFENLPYSTAKDVFFFIKRSNQRLKNTRLFSMLSKILLPKTSLKG